MEDHLFVGIDRGIIILGLLRWCEMDFVHPLWGCHFGFTKNNSTMKPSEVSGPPHAENGCKGSRSGMQPRQPKTDAIASGPETAQPLAPPDPYFHLLKPLRKNICPIMIDFLQVTRK